MFRIKNVFFYLVGVLFLGAITAPIVWLMLSAMVKLSIVGIIALPFYGLYRAKKGLNDTKGIKALISPVWKFIKKAIKVNVYNFSVFLIMGVVIAILFDSIVESLVRTLIVSLIALFVTYVAWEAVRHCLKLFKNIEIPEFKTLIKSAIQ